MTILVTGGCGHVGTKLTEAIAARTDHAVTVVERRGSATTCDRIRG
jgi:nucleoside-diphosphate-sugar epimerase